VMGGKKAIQVPIGGGKEGRVPRKRKTSGKKTVECVGKNKHVDLPGGKRPLVPGPKRHLQVPEGKEGGEKKDSPRRRPKGCFPQRSTSQGPVEREEGGGACRLPKKRGKTPQEKKHISLVRRLGKKKQVVRKKNPNGTKRTGHLKKKTPPSSGKKMSEKEVSLMGGKKSSRSPPREPGVRKKARVGREERRDFEKAKKEPPGKEKNLSDGSKGTCSQTPACPSKGRNPLKSLPLEGEGTEKDERFLSERVEKNREGGGPRYREEKGRLQISAGAPARKKKNDKGDRGSTKKKGGKFFAITPEPTEEGNQTQKKRQNACPRSRGRKGLNRQKKKRERAEEKNPPKKGRRRSKGTERKGRKKRVRVRRKRGRLGSPGG